MDKYILVTEKTNHQVTHSNNIENQYLIPAHSIDQVTLDLTGKEKDDNGAPIYSMSIETAGFGSLRAYSADNKEDAYYVSEALRAWLIDDDKGKGSRVFKVSYVKQGVPKKPKEVYEF